jgi:hypothetical protein
LCIRSDWSSVAYACTTGVEVAVETDAKKRDASISVEENRRTMAKTEGTSWRTVLGTTSYSSGLHYWEIHPDVAEWGTVAFGVAHPKKFTLSNSCGHSFANYRGLVGSAEQLYGEHFGMGNVVGMLLDMDQRCISFFKV